LDDTIADTQGALPHTSITTTENVYVQMLDSTVARAINLRGNEVLDGWSLAEKSGLKGQNIRKVLELSEQG